MTRIQKIGRQNVKILDNITNTVRDDLRAEIVRGSKVSIAAACFSMYAYQELKKQLEAVEEFCQGKGGEAEARVLHPAPLTRDEPLRHRV